MFRLPLRILRSLQITRSYNYISVITRALSYINLTNVKDRFSRNVSSRKRYEKTVRDNCEAALIHLAFA